MYLLLAEDEKDLSKALAVILKHNNYTVDTVYDGQTALDYILAKNNIPIETEYKTPSKGLHVVIADVSAIQNFPKVEQDLRIFDDGKNVGRVQLVHANMDGKLILYSNVNTAGY